MCRSKSRVSRWLAPRGARVQLGHRVQSLTREVDGWRAHRDPARFLAKRFAAKEAFGKALGTGVAVPATLHAVAVAHDARGKPEYRYDERLAAHMRDNALRAHLSISDEDEHIVAFALIERA